MMKARGKGPEVEKVAVFLMPLAMCPLAWRFL